MQKQLDIEVVFHLLPKASGEPEIGSSEAQMSSQCGHELIELIDCNFVADCWGHHLHHLNLFLLFFSFVLVFLSMEPEIELPSCCWFFVPIQSAHQQQPSSHWKGFQAPLFEVSKSHHHKALGTLFPKALWWFLFCSLCTWIVILGCSPWSSKMDQFLRSNTSLSLKNWLNPSRCGLLWHWFNWVLALLWGQLFLHLFWVVWKEGWSDGVLPILKESSSQLCSCEGVTLLRHEKCSWLEEEGCCIQSPPSLWTKSIGLHIPQTHWLLFCLLKMFFPDVF